MYWLEMELFFIETVPAVGYALSLPDALPSSVPPPRPEKVSMPDCAGPIAPASPPNDACNCAIGPGPIAPPWNCWEHRLLEQTCAAVGQPQELDGPPAPKYWLRMEPFMIAKVP